MVDGSDVAAALDGPLVVLFDEDGADEPNDGLFEDADHLGAALDLPVVPVCPSRVRMPRRCSIVGAQFLEVVAF